MHKIKAIMFDVDNTIVPTSDFVKVARKSAIDALFLGGLKADRKEVTKRLDKIIEKYGPNHQSHLDVLLDELGMPKKVSNKLVARATIAYHNAKQILQPYPDVPETLVSLKESGYKLYAVSEGLSKKQWEKIFRTGLDSVLSDAFMTEDYGFQIKQLEFFRVVLAEIKVKGNMTVMVGDRLDKDIMPAKENGIHTIRVRSGKYENQSFRNVKADYEIKKFSELIKIIPLIESKL